MKVKIICVDIMNAGIDKWKVGALENEVNKFLEDKPNAIVHWKQSSSVESLTGRVSTFLTTIITYQ